MSERPESAGLVVPLLVAVTVLGLGFGGGAWIGRATQEQKPRVTGPKPMSARAELAACRRELKALTKARAVPPAALMPPPGGMDDAGAERAAKVEALYKDVLDCQFRETLQNAYVCGTIGDHIGLYDVLVHGTSCVDPPGIGEHLLNSVDKCAGFEELPVYLDKDQLSKLEQTRIFESKINHHAQSKENLIKSMQRIRRECRRIWALPPE